MFKIGSIFIPVTDIEKSSAWYEKHLGVQKIDSWEDGVGYYFPNGSTQLGLVKVDAQEPTEFVIEGNKKNAYYNFIVQDIEAAYQHFNDHGVVTTEIEEFSGMRWFDFFDLDGNPFSVVNENINSPFHSDHVKKLQKNDLES